MLQFICIKLQIPRYLHIVVTTTLVALHVDTATQILIKDLDGGQPLLLLPPLMRMMVNFS